MNIKVISMSLMSMYLVACATTSHTTAQDKGFYQGQSVTYGIDNVLRNDVTKALKKIEKSYFSCKQQERITVQTISSKRSKDVFLIDEKWVVKGCNKVRTYPITFRDKGKKGTTFEVKIPARKK